MGALEPRRMESIARSVADRMDASWRTNPSSGGGWAGSLAGQIVRETGVDRHAAWTPALAMAVATHRTQPLAPRSDKAGLALFGDSDAIPKKAVRLAHALVTDDVAGVVAEDLRWLVEAFENRWGVEVDIGEAAARMLAIKLAMPPVTAADTATFLYAWRGRRPRSRVTQGVYVGSSTVPLGRVAAAEAPIVARLSWPGGGTLDLRCHSGVLLRPVLAPGSTRPIDLGGFLEAAGRGAPWADSPFAHRQGDHHVLLGPSDYAGPQPSLPAPGDAEAMRRAADDAQARAGTLVVIDGIVHRATEPPSLYLRSADAPGTIEGEIHVSRVDVSIAWEFPDGLDMHDDQRTITRKSPDHRRHYLDGHRDSGDLAFPPGFGADLESLAADWIGNVEPTDWHRPTYRPGVPCEVLDPSAFPSLEGAALTALEGFEAQFGDEGATGIRDAVAQAREAGVPIDVDGYQARLLGPDAYVDVRELLPRLVTMANETFEHRADLEDVADFRP